MASESNVWVSTVAATASSSPNNHHHYHHQHQVPWIEKYRPKALRQVVGHDLVRQTFEQFMRSGQWPHLILHGSPGTGKTSMIWAVLGEMGCVVESGRVLELNASDERGIDVVRSKIKEFCQSQTAIQSAEDGVRHKQRRWIILDEADALTQVAQMALRRIIEQTDAQTRFCLLANAVDRLLPALQSRCTRFRFVPLSEMAIAERLDVIARHEQLSVSRAARLALLSYAQGDLRRAVNVLQAAARWADLSITLSSSSSVRHRTRHDAASPSHRDSLRDRGRSLPPSRYRHHHHHHRRQPTAVEQEHVDQACGHADRRLFKTLLDQLTNSNEEEKEENGKRPSLAAAVHFCTERILGQGWSVLDLLHRLHQLLVDRLVVLPCVSISPISAQTKSRVSTSIDKPLNLYRVRHWLIELARLEHQIQSTASTCHAAHGTTRGNRLWLAALVSIFYSSIK